MWSCAFSTTCSPNGCARSSASTPPIAHPGSPRQPSPPRRCFPGAECAFFAGENLYTRDEYVLGKDDEFAGKTGGELRARHNMLVIERERGGESLLLPPLDQPILAGDRIAVVAPLKTLVAQRARR